MAVLVLIEDHINFTGRNPVAGMEAGAAAPGALEWAGLVLVCLVLPAVISWAVAALMRRAGLIADGDLKLED